MRERQNVSALKSQIKMAELHGFKNINSVKQLKAGDKVYKINKKQKYFTLRLSAVKILKTDVNLGRRTYRFTKT